MKNYKIEKHERYSVVSSKVIRIKKMKNNDDFKDLILSEKIAIYCNTIEKANELCDYLDSIGAKWCNGWAYKNNTKWDDYKENTCYLPYSGEFSYFEFYYCKGIKIVKYEDVANDIKKSIETKNDKSVKLYKVEFNEDLILNQKTIINCNTRAKAKSLCNWLDSIGETWCDGDSYKNFQWYEYEDKTCYFPNIGKYNSIDFYKDLYKEEKQNILTYEDVLI